MRRLLLAVLASLALAAAAPAADGPNRHRALFPRLRARLDAIRGRVVAREILRRYPELKAVDPGAWLRRQLSSLADQGK